ncbi:uncharacterized protein AB675_756 [Cyphellophora attinorum]|uniref:Uncharacterized protein n=1 Tax=Cyphellophora attinorum TaxID=1664694 RepID=A0A0N1HGV6_9EURO|nr:uncharacterized protein AB675_756 [Phialophora attinorum]KPI45547.1 hypothetical protein AB675_756 [Phialophora attinorum]
MDFIRRKSGPQAAHGPQEEEPSAAPRVRNRLSKPRSLNHNLKASSSQLRLEALDTGAQHAEPRSEFTVVEPTESGTDGPSTNPRVSDLITRLEANQKTSSQTSLPLSKRRDSYRGSMTSITEQKLTSLTTSSSHPRLTTLKNDSKSTISPAQSVDDLRLSEIPNFSRRSSFKPGAATRKSSQVEIILEEPEPNKNMLQDDKPQQSFVDDDARSFVEGDDEAWYPPPQVGRPETPRSLIDYPHLGSLTPGSLQVTNGRASPTGSNMSKQLITHQFSRQSRVRDVSSEYDQSVYDDQSLPASLNGDSVYSTKNRYRDFSWQSRGSSKLRNDDAPPMPDTDAVCSDPASFLADEYMAELPASPFAVRKSSLQNFAHRVALAGLEGSVRPESYLSYQSADIHDERRASSPVPSVKSETGTILVTTTKTTEADDDLFEDEALGGSPTRDRFESSDSWHATSVVDENRVQSNDGLDTEYAVDFTTENQLTLLQSVGDVQVSKTMSSTTIEIDTTMLTPAQTAEIHEMDANGYESDLRFHSPIELEPLSSWTPNFSSPEPRKSFHKSDSGYSSNVSLRSSSGERKQSMSKISSELDRRSLVGKVFRPILKSRRTSTEVVTTRKSTDKARPTPTRAQTSIAALSDAPTQRPPQAAVVEVKKTNRLTKRLTSGKQFQPVVLQTIQSIDDLSIPPVSTEAAEHLRIRTQAVPELESTYRSMDHVRNRLSVSTVSMLDDYPEIRFPSPEPERKQARRRSWFGKVVEDKPSKPEKPEPKYKSSKRDSWNVTDISQEHAMAIVNEWQTQAPSLGGSHYDQIPSRRNSMKLYQQQQQQQQEPQQGLRRPSRLRQKKRNMDDKEAAEFARIRSASIRERDAWKQQQPAVLRRSTSGQRTSMESRRSASRKRSSRTSSATRTTQPIPEAITQRIQKALSASREASRESSPHRMLMDQDAEASLGVNIPAPNIAPPPPPPPHSPRPMSIDEEEHSSPPHPSHAPPPPPPHSPRPTSINHDYFSEHQAVAEDDFAPPPPSHSPRPMDVTPTQEEADPWAAQADRWRALRRQVSQEAVRESGIHVGQYETDVYPSLPPMNRQLPNRYTITNGTYDPQSGWEDGFGYKQDRTYSYAHEAWTWDTQGQYHQQQHYTASPSAWKGYYGNQY